MLSALEKKYTIDRSLTNWFKDPKNFILLFFGIIYCLISLVNHYNYRTYAFDLGIYNNCLYQYAHFHKNHYPYLHSLFNDFLSDHFSLYTIIFSPLYYIFGTITLLLIQIAAILFGALGIYKIVKQDHETGFLPHIAMIHFLTFFGIYSALAFDYHDNVVSAMLLPWFFYYFKNKKVVMVWLFAVLIVIGKENMPIWLIFVCLALAILNFNNKAKRNLALALSLFSLIYAVVILKYVMPNIDPYAPGNSYNQLQYSVLGTNINEAISTLFHHPAKIVNALFFNHLKDPSLDGVKIELYICLLYSGCWLLILRPAYLIMLIPIIAQKVFSDNFVRWGISYHYSIEFIPVIIVGFYDIISRIPNNKPRMLLAIAGCCFSIYITKKKFDYREIVWTYNRENTVVYSKKHYQCIFDRQEVKRVMNLIPKDANLSCLNLFASHLSFRKNIYQYPDIYDAEYILLASTEKSYPLYGAKLDNSITGLRHSPDWEMLSDSKGIYLFKRKSSH